MKEINFCKLLEMRLIECHIFYSYMFYNPCYKKLNLIKLKYPIIRNESSDFMEYIEYIPSKHLEDILRDSPYRLRRHLFIFNHKLERRFDLIAPDEKVVEILLKFG